MVKFSKQFEGQLVPEWKEAFVDYRQLKKELKKIHLLNNQNHMNNNQNDNNSFPDKLLSALRRYTFKQHKQREHTAIQVHRKCEASAGEGELYETELMEQFADTDAAFEFFSCLDLQRNKVNQFFMKKEEEFVQRGDSLKEQMEILLDLKTEVKRKHASHSQDSREDYSISGTISCDEDFVRSGTDVEQGLEVSSYETDKFDAESADSPKPDKTGKLIKMKKDEMKLRYISSREINCRGKNLRENIPLTNPTCTFSAISYLLWDELANNSSKKCGLKDNKLHISRRKLHHAEKMIKGAFIELYKGLGHLKTYRNLNMLAFAKILKKFDKVTNKRVLPIYFRVVETSYFNSSDKALKLADEVEELFVKHFAQDDKRKAMKYLKPAQRKESHSITFLIGLFTGCFLALFAGYIITAHLTGVYHSEPNGMYMETVFPVLSMFSLLFLHLFLYGCNIVMWGKMRINYSFIFELSPRRELKYRDIFLICSTSVAAVVGVLLVHLSLVAKGYSYAEVQPIIILLVAGFVLVLVCPFNIIYKSSRYHFLSVIRNIILSPLYKVVMLDFFVADQLCSQVPMLRELEYVACYYITRSSRNQDYQYCLNTTYYKDLAYAVSFLPYYWRAMQCARRWFDEGHTNHLMNLGKYVSAMLAAGAKVAYEKEKNTGWFCVLVIISSVATLYQLYWDYVKDWGLLQVHSKNPWLRDELMLKHKFIYFFSMVLNLILRLAWLQTIFHYNFKKVDYRVTMLFLAALEVIRRGQWNFYRLENEHLNNAGKFRAVKTVPLPFHEVKDQD